MTTPENPFDQTIWDPIDSEQAIEDPIHGSESVLRRLATPPMPLLDGTYHVFGGYDLIGTCTFDANGKPFHKLSVISSPMDTLREVQMMEDWLKKVEEGDLPEGYPSPDFFDLSATPYFVVEGPDDNA